MADCGGLPQVDQPAKVIEALKYFIQGMGYSKSPSLHPKIEVFSTERISP